MPIENYIEWFRHSSTYINAHRGRVFVVLLTGETLAHANFPNIVHDIALLNSLGVKLVLIHGARPQINTALKKAGIESSYSNNLRITEAPALVSIKETVGALSIDIEAVFSMGLVNSPMHGASIRLVRGNFVTAKPVGIADGVDFCHTGLVRKIDVDALNLQLSQNSIVLMSNLGYSPTGEIFNISAEQVATETAIALKADKLILFTAESGVFDNNQNLLNSLSVEEACQILEDHRDEKHFQIIKPTIEAAIKACENRIPRCHLISFEDNGALLKELFTRDGAGTLITCESYEQLKQATIEDVGGILKLIKPLEEEGILVERSRELLETEIDYFQIIERDGMAIGCAALYPLDQESGEIACIAVHKDYLDGNRGQHLLSSLEEKARQMGLKQVFVLSTNTSHWFIERGFVEVSKDELPRAKQSLYNYQRNSKVFKIIL